MKRITINKPISIAIITLIVLLSGVSYFTSEQTPSDVEIREDNTFAPSLPESWKEVESTDELVTVQYEKDSKATIKPTIVFIESEFEDENQNEYVDKIIKGTQQSLPSFTIDSDDASETRDVFTRIITGHYINSGIRVNVRQHISIANNRVYTMTASTDPEETENLNQEILSIFNVLHNTYVTPVI